MNTLVERLRYVISSDLDQSSNAFVISKVLIVKEAISLANGINASSARIDDGDSLSRSSSEKMCSSAFGFSECDAERAKVFVELAHAGKRKEVGY